MDDYHVKDFWGISPAIDLFQLGRNSAICREDFNILQVSDFLLNIGPGDCRHTLCTLAGLLSSSDNKTTHNNNIYVYETKAEDCARHLTLLSILLDESLSVDDRVEIFLEVFGNVCLQRDTARFVARLGQRLETLVLNSFSHQDSDDSNTTSKLFDFSLLSFKERDLLAAALNSYSSEALFDMESAWDIRCRKYYKDHYDYRRNQMDWDYWMKLSAMHKENDHMTSSIIHKQEFIKWRSCGIAFELQKQKEGSQQPNLTLISNIAAHTKEYKDRYGKDIGREVIARGYWGDIVNSPYHAFGTTSCNDALFERKNKEFIHNTNDVTRYNLKHMIQQIRLSPENGYSFHKSLPKVVFLTGDLERRVIKNKSLLGQCDVVYLSWRQAHLLRKEVQLEVVFGANSLLTCEHVSGFLGLSKDQVAQFRDNVRSMANDQDWNEISEPLQLLPSVKSYFMCFTKSQIHN